MSNTTLSAAGNKAPNARRILVATPLVPANRFMAPRRTESSPADLYSMREDNIIQDDMKEHVQAAKEIDIDQEQVSAESKGGAFVDNGTAADMTAKQAQENLSPKTSVFVGNLSRNCADEFLADQLLAQFSAFGRCWVNVRRKAVTNNPFAFVQYEDEKIATAVVEKMRTLMNESKAPVINGRPIRVEVTVGFSTGYFTRLNGGAMNQVEVEEQFAMFRVSALWAPTKTELALYHLGNGWFVEFETHGHFLKALKKFKSSKDFAFVQFERPGSPGKVLRPMKSSPKTPTRQQRAQFGLSPTHQEFGLSTLNHLGFSPVHAGFSSPQGRFSPVQVGFSPNQGGFPPNQGDFPPTHGGFLPNQGGFPPTQGGFLPNQGGFLPNQGGFMPNQGGFLPNQGGFMPNQGGFLPNQGGFPPTQGGFPPNQGGFSPNQGSFPPTQGSFSPAQGSSQPSHGGFSEMKTDTGIGSTATPMEPREEPPYPYRQVIVTADTKDSLDNNIKQVEFSCGLVSDVIPWSDCAACVTFKYVDAAASALERFPSFVHPDETAYFTQGSPMSVYHPPHSFGGHDGADGDYLDLGLDGSAQSAYCEEALYDADEGASEQQMAPDARLGTDEPDVESDAEPELDSNNEEEVSDSAEEDEDAVPSNENEVGAGASDGGSTTNLPPFQLLTNHLEQFLEHSQSPAIADAPPENDDGDSDSSSSTDVSSTGHNMNLLNQEAMVWGNQSNVPTLVGSPISEGDIPDESPIEGDGGDMPPVNMAPAGQPQWARASMPEGGIPVGTGCVVREINGNFFVGALMGLMSNNYGDVSAVRWALPGLFAVAQDYFGRRRCGVLICHPWDFAYDLIGFQPSDWTELGYKIPACEACPPGAGVPMRCDFCIYIMLTHKRQAYDRGLLPMPTV